MNDTTLPELTKGTNASHQLVAASQCLFRLGDACENFVFVSSGQVRVELLSSQGQQLLLYRIQGGESCVMTTACLLGNNHYSAQAITDTQVELTLIPRADFHRCISESAPFRDFVFNGFSSRLAALMQRTTELATWSVDQRLAAALTHHAEQNHTGAPLALTHDQLAVEIGTAREVVSRRLSALANQGLIARQRGQIEVLDITGLKEKLAQ